MPGSFAPRLDILPPPQRRLWDEFSTLPPAFVLYGGTAVALHLGHRQSVDFDFFADRHLAADTANLLVGAMVTQRAPDTLSVLVDRGGPVRVSFFGVPALPRLLPPLRAPDTGLRIASLLDLAGTKMSVVQMRAEAKDYIDIDAILATRTLDLATALAAGAALYGAGFNPQVTLKALTFFDDGDLATLTAALRARLVDAVRRVDLDRLPVLGASP